MNMTELLMKRNLLALTLVGGLAALTQSAHAQSAGVKCPTGFDAEYQDNVLKCSRMERVYVYPAGHDFGNATTPNRGVKCPADGNDRVSYQNGTLKCVDVKRETVKAYCMLPWTLTVKSGQDACKSVVGNMDPTLPDGQLSREGWELLPDHEGQKDFWRRTTTKFEWPVAR